LGDEALYMEIAKNILFDFKFNVPGNAYPPGYPLFISPSQIFLPDFNLTYHVVLIINSFLSSLIVFPAYYISRKFLDRNTSIILAFFILTLPATFLYSFTVMSENLFIPLYMFSCWIILEAFSRNTPSCWIISGFSLFSLYFTRTIGIAAITAFFFLILYDVYQSKEKFSSFLSKWPVALSFGLPLIAYNLYNTVFMQKAFHISNAANILNAGISGYSSDNYIQVIQEGMFTDLFGFVSLFSRIICNEIGYYFFAGFFIFIIFAFFGLYNSMVFHYQMQSKTFNILFWYAIITTIGLIGISSVHLAKSYAPYGYTLLMGRYLEPTIPVLIILGTIGYVNYMKLSPMKKNLSVYLCIIFTTIFIVTCIIFPLTSYRWANTISVYHFIRLQNIQVMSGISAFLTLLFLIFIIGIVIIVVRNVKYLIAFGVVLSLIGIVIVYSGPMLSMNHLMAGNMEGSDQMAVILAVAEKNSVILYDQDLILSSEGKWLFYMVRWWAHEKINFTNTTSITSDFTYLISDKQLPYEPLSYNKKLNVTLYKQ